jgi:hypothetical protein
MDHRRGFPEALLEMARFARDGWIGSGRIASRHTAGAAVMFDEKNGPSLLE